MTRKNLATLGIVIVLLVSAFGTAGAQSGDGDTPTVPTIPTTQPGSKFFNHPVVVMLSAYFDQDMAGDDVVDPADPADPNAPVDGAPATGSGLGPVGEQIAAYHEEGMGFGVLVKIYSLVKASEEACKNAAAPVADDTATGDDTGAPATTCTPLTAEELITSFKGGQGMGAIFKEHGKPNLLGVGHVKQELKKQDKQAAGDDEQTLEDGDVETQDSDKGKPEKNKDKGKPDKNKDKGKKP